jgi:lipoprotein-releasing system permease protein
MKVSVNLKIVKVHLLSRKRQTIIAMLGVTFGIAMFILMISFMSGVNKFMMDLAMATTPDIQIYNDYKLDLNSSVARRFFGPDPKTWIVVSHPRPKQITLNLKNASGIISDIRKYNDVIAVSPLLSTLLICHYGPVEWAANVDGVNIIEEDRLLDLSSKMVEGRVENLLATDNGILLGYKMAEQLNLRMGDLLTLTSQTGTQMRFRVVGIYKFGIAMMDQFKAFINLASMQQIMGKNPDYITHILVKLKDYKQAKVRAASFARKYGYKSDDWETVNASLKSGNVIRDTMTYIISVTLLVVAGFGIYNIMNMVITSKLKDIAILKAQGFSGRDIMQIFLFQSLIIGVTGAAAGLLLGFLLSYLLSRTPFPEDEWVVIEYYPVLFRIGYYVFGVAFGVLTTLVAGIFPALKASRVDPVAILRG